MFEKKKLKINMKIWEGSHWIIKKYFNEDVAFNGLNESKKDIFLLRKEEGWLSSYSSLITLSNKRSLKLLIEFHETILSFLVLLVRFKNENV